MHYQMKLFHYFYFNLYKTSRDKNAAPEIPVLGFITFCQVFNVLTVINLILFGVYPGCQYQIHKLFLVLVVLFYGFNFYYFQKRGIGKSIRNQSNYDLGRKIIWIYLYFILSVAFAGLSYYLLREF